MLGTGAANLVGLLDIDRVMLGGRTVAADPDAYVRGVRAVIDERARRGGIDAPVPVTATGEGTGRSRRGPRSWSWPRCSGGSQVRTSEASEVRTGVRT